MIWTQLTPHTLIKVLLIAFGSPFIHFDLPYEVNVCLLLNVSQFSSNQNTWKSQIGQCIISLLECWITFVWYIIFSLENYVYFNERKKHLSHKPLIFVARLFQNKSNLNVVFKEENFKLQLYLYEDLSVTLHYKRVYITK